jgi:hypothetical protein
MALSTYAYAFQWFWAETILYFAFTPILLYYVRPAQPFAAYISLAFLTFFYARTAILAILAEHKIERLGYRAPRVRDYYPFGLGTLVKALYYFSNW